MQGVARGHHRHRRRPFLLKQTLKALKTKRARLQNAGIYFDQYFGFTGRQERVRMGQWVDHKLRMMNCHCIELKATARVLNVYVESFALGEPLRV